MSALIFQALGLKVSWSLEFVKICYLHWIANQIFANETNTPKLTLAVGAAKYLITSLVTPFIICMFIIFHFVPCFSLCFYICDNVSDFSKSTVKNASNKFCKVQVY